MNGSVPAHPFLWSATAVRGPRGRGPRVSRLIGSVRRSEAADRSRPPGSRCKGMQRERSTAPAGSISWSSGFQVSRSHPYPVLLSGSGIARSVCTSRGRCTCTPMRCGFGLRSVLHERLSPQRSSESDSATKATRHPGSFKHEKQKPPASIGDFSHFGSLPSFPHQASTQPGIFIHAREIVKVCPAPTIGDTGVVATHISAPRRWRAGVLRASCRKARLRPGR